MNFIMIKNVRCSFPAFFQKPIINGEVGTYGCKLILDQTEHGQAIAQIYQQCEEFVRTKLQGMPLSPDRYCIRDGNQSHRPEYHGKVILSTGSNQPVCVVDATGQHRIIDESQNKIYSGCRVNAKVNLWLQDNKYGKRINCNIASVQFERDDEPLAAHISEAEAMEGFGPSSGAPAGFGAPSQGQAPGQWTPPPATPAPSAAPGFPGQQQAPGFPGQQQAPGFPGQQQQQATPAPSAAPGQWTPPPATPAPSAAPGQWTPPPATPAPSAAPGQPYAPGQPPGSLYPGNINLDNVPF